MVAFAAAALDLLLEVLRASGRRERPSIPVMLIAETAARGGDPSDQAYGGG